jgi:hypothetical protein
MQNNNLRYLNCQTTEQLIAYTQYCFSCGDNFKDFSLGLKVRECFWRDPGAFCFYADCRQQQYFLVKGVLLTMKRFFLPCLLLVLSFPLFSQSTPENSKSNLPARSETNGPTSLNPYSGKSTYAPKENKRTKNRRAKLTPEEDFYQRMQLVAKAKMKQEEEMKKPQYSNPMYFGHKKPPKKRSPKKMKFCKECGIRH